MTTGRDGSVIEILHSLGSHEVNLHRDDRAAEHLDLRDHALQTVIFGGDQHIEPVAGELLRQLQTDPARRSRNDGQLAAF